MKTVIYHIDVNSAFLSWEAAYRLHHLGGTLDLRTIPSAVSGDMAARHGIILAKSVPAKRFGIHTGQTVLEARQKCPALYMVPPNYGLYQKCSDAFIKLLGEYTPSVEQYSIDEAFMDMSSTMHLFGSPADTARNIRDRIREELGFTVNIGISSNKLLAKMASGFRKPDRVHTLFPEEIQEKMWPLPVSDLFFVGRATASKLLKLGIRTIGDPPPQKGYGNSTTIAFDVTDMETAHLVLLGLAETVGSRLRENQVQAELMSVGIKSFDLSYASHQMILDNPTNITTELYRFACRLFDHLWDGRTAIRHLGIHTGRLQDGMALRQMSLFDTADYAKLETWDSTIDSIRKRYGMDAVRRAAFLDTPIDHLEGGISREKRDVDYSRLCIQ